MVDEQRLTARISELERNYSALLDAHLDGQERDRRLIRALQSRIAELESEKKALKNHVDRLESYLTPEELFDVAYS